MRQSRLTVWTSSAVVTDQKPGSSGYSLMRSVQWTGHWLRNCLNSSCGGPSSQSSRSATSTLSRSLANGRHRDLQIVVADPVAAIILAARPGRLRDGPIDREPVQVRADGDARIGPGRARPAREPR